MAFESFVKVPYHFQGITILVPKQTGNDILAIDKGSFLPEGIQNQTGNFTLIRHIANIVLYSRMDYEQGKMNPVKTFDPPIEVRVGYKSTDLKQNNGDVHRLKLAYWDGSQWVIISDPAHEYFVLPSSTGQVAEAKIWSWVGDPPIAWGK